MLKEERDELPNTELVPSLIFFGGLIFIAAAGGFISRDVALWHAFLAGGIFGCYLFVALLVLLPLEFGVNEAARVAALQGTAFTATTFTGVWLGRQARKQWNKVKEQQTMQADEVRSDSHDERR